MLVGLAFDPSATASNLVLWATHSFFAFNAAPDWSGKLTRLSGPDLATVQDYVVGLPRSIRDHETNSVAFGPDGKLYLSQGSNTAMGAPDDAWGNRPEHVLNAAVLRVDLAAITEPRSDVKTGTAGPTTRSRRPRPSRSSRAACATRSTWSGTATATSTCPPTARRRGGHARPPRAAAGGLPEPDRRGHQRRLHRAGGDPGEERRATQHDYLFASSRTATTVTRTRPLRVGPERRQPDRRRPRRSPATRSRAYPVGTQPDRNWRGSAYDFGLHYSTNGVIEYTANAFGSALEGRCWSPATARATTSSS